MADHLLVVAGARALDVSPAARLWAMRELAARVSLRVPWSVRREGAPIEQRIKGIVREVFCVSAHTATVRHTPTPFARQESARKALCV